MAFDCSASGLAQRRSVQGAAASLIELFVNNKKPLYFFNLSSKLFGEARLTIDLQGNAMAKLPSLSEGKLT